MMKKIVSLSFLALCGLFSAQASATSGSFTTSSSITPDPAGTYVCEALNNNITVQLSEGVVAAYNCAAAGDSFKAATCHAQGTNKQQTVSCVYKQDSAGTWYTDTSTQCPAYDPNMTAADKIVTFQGRLGYVGGSAGGSVSESQIDGTQCTTTTAAALIPSAY